MVNRGYLLSYAKYGDSDAILHCFTRERGFQSFFMRGMYSVRNKKKAYLSPLNELVFVTNDYSKSSIINITKIEQVEPLGCIQDIRISAIVFFISEFLCQVLQSEVRQDDVYDMIEGFKEQLEFQNYQAHFVFLIKFLQLQGLAPLLSDGSYLNAESGAFEAVIYHEMFGEEVSSLWKEIVISEKHYTVRVKNGLKENFLNSILFYYHCHFPNFKTPKSLDVLRQIFAD